MKLTQFELETPSGVTVKGDYEGSANSRKILIFSHGFGVTRDSHGMFNELGDLLKDHYLVVRFDYTIVNKEENWTKVYPYSTQVAMSREVDRYFRQKFEPNEVNIIAHSMGCLIVGLAKLENIKRILLLSGPPSAPYKRMKEYFSKRPGTKINEKGMSTIKRSDGSLTYVGKDFWKEMKDINPPILYSDLAEDSEVTFVRALSDQVITEMDYTGINDNKRINFVEIDGNHDFGGEVREELKEIVREFFNVEG